MGRSFFPAFFSKQIPKNTQYALNKLAKKHASVTNRKNRITDINSGRSVTNNSRLNRNNRIPVAHNNRLVANNNRLVANNSRVNRNNGKAVISRGLKNGMNTTIQNLGLPSTPRYPPGLTMPKQKLVYDMLPKYFYTLKTHHARLLGGNEANSPFKKYTYNQLIRNPNILRKITPGQLKTIGNLMYYRRNGTISDNDRVLRELLAPKAMPVPTNSPGFTARLANLKKGIPGV